MQLNDSHTIHSKHYLKSHIILVCKYRKRDSKTSIVKSEFMVVLLYMGVHIFFDLTGWRPNSFFYTVHSSTFYFSNSPQDSSNNLIWKLHLGCLR